MAKKADLEAAYTLHDDLCRQAAALEVQHDFRSALRRAEDNRLTGEGGLRERFGEDAI